MVRVGVGMAEEWRATELRVAQIRARTEAATPGPWWADETRECWRLHGAAFTVPAQGEVPGQVMNRQILKAPKCGTPYAEYWPGAADAEFIVMARDDVPFLLAELERCRKVIDGLRAELAVVRAARGDVTRGG